MLSPSLRFIALALTEDNGQACVEFADLLVAQYRPVLAEQALRRCAERWPDRSELADRLAELVERRVGRVNGGAIDGS